MNDTNESAAFQESIPAPPEAQHKERRSSITKLMDAVKKPFHREPKDVPPALQAAIDKMEARKQGTAEKMEAEGKDTTALSGKKTDLIK